MEAPEQGLLERLRQEPHTEGEICGPLRVVSIDLVLVSVAKHMEKIEEARSRLFLGDVIVREGTHDTVEIGIVPGVSVHGERANFTGLVLGCIEADFCK